MPGMLMGVAGLIFSGWMFAHAQADLRVYSGDASCAEGFAANVVPAGQCRTETVRINHVYRTTGKGARRYVVLDMRDGSQQTVTYGKDQYGNLWRGAATPFGDRVVTAQYFRTAIVALRTRSGAADTDAMPMDRLSQWALFGTAAGAAGFISALIQLARLR